MCFASAYSIIVVYCGNSLEDCCVSSRVLQCINFNPRVLEWNGMELSLSPLQHMWIEMNTCASKQGLNWFGGDCVSLLISLIIVGGYRHLDDLVQ